MAHVRPAQAVLVLCDGDLPAMVALSLAQDAAGQASAVGVLSAPVVPSGSALVAERIEALAESQSVRCLEFSAVSPAAVSTGHRRSRYLLEAVHQAVSNGYGSLVCPWQAEGFDPAADRRPDALPDVDALARELDRTLLVSRLATLDAPEHGAAVFEVQAPLMDLSDEQVAELALDLDVPIWRAWWWSLAEAQRPKDAALAELARACRSRWCSALERLGWSAQAEAAAAR